MSLREMLMDLSRPGDVLARMGGDEFAMWLDGVGADVAGARAQELIKRSTCMKNMSGAVDKLVGLSVGIAMFLPDSGENLENLIARADSAMYAVKRKGKGGFQMASAERDGKILIKT
jgi:diguanylate cyclase (GGDEF)-like protein